LIASRSADFSFARAPRGLDGFRIDPGPDQSENRSGRRAPLRQRRSVSQYPGAAAIPAAPRHDPENASAGVIRSGIRFSEKIMLNTP
jgi:hypothetical protein